MPLHTQGNEAASAVQEGESASTQPQSPPGLSGVWLHWCDLHCAPTSPCTAARQAATLLGFLFAALRPTLAQNSFPFMGLGMVEIRACNDFNFSCSFFFFNFNFLKHTFYLARFCSGWVTARGMTYKQQKSQIALAKGGESCFSQNRHLINLKYISSVCTSICPIKYCIL